MPKKSRSHYDKLNYVPLPNLKESLKSFIRDPEDKVRVDKLTKRDVIARFRTFNLDEEQVENIYSNYRYGGRLSFQLLSSLKPIDSSGFWSELKQYKAPAVPDDLPYEKLPLVKDLSFTDNTKLDNDTIEIGFKYASLIKYIGVDSAEEPSHVYETRYGFLWVNFKDSYVILITKDEKISKQITDICSIKLELPLFIPKLPKSLVDKIFPKLNAKAITFSEMDTGISQKISFVDDASSTETGMQKLEELEKSGDRRSSAKYSLNITPDEISSVVGVNADKAKVTVMKIFSTDEIRKWGLQTFQNIHNEIKNIKITNIDEYFNIFEKKFFEGQKYNPIEKNFIKKMCAGVYNAILKDDNYELELKELPIFEDKVIVDKFFNVIPRFTCNHCDELHSPKCCTCGANYKWNEKYKSLECEQCAMSFGEDILLRCDNNNSSHTYKIEECISLVPKSILIDIITDFIGLTGEIYNNEINSFYVFNSILYFFNNAPSVEVTLTDISQFKNADLTLRVNQSALYKELKSEVDSFKEKCNKSSLKMCNDCLEHPELKCLMKLFKYLEPTYHLEPHKGTEYGDVSFSTKLNGRDTSLKIIMKSSKAKSITSGTATGREILGQVITQYLKDSYETVLGVLITPGLDRSLRQDIIQLVKYKKGKVFFVEEEQLVSLFQLAKQNRFNS